MKTLKLKIKVPEGANVYAENGDKTINLLLYEVEQLELLHEIPVNTKRVNLLIKDGQFVKKGDVIFSEGLFGHKAFVSDFNGIAEIKENSLKILGQKKHMERRINLQGNVEKVIPKKTIRMSCSVTPLDHIYYFNKKRRLTDQIYIHDKKDISSDKISSPDTQTIFINDNIFVEDLAKLIALGAKRVIINAIFVDSLENLKREVHRLESFCILSGFGEYLSRKIHPINPKMNIYWGGKKVYFSDNIVRSENAVYEHPFWGLSGKWHRKTDLVGGLEYNNEILEFYLKNIEHNA